MGKIVKIRYVLKLVSISVLVICVAFGAVACGMTGILGGGFALNYFYNEEDDNYTNSNNQNGITNKVTVGNKVGNICYSEDLTVVTEVDFSQETIDPTETGKITIINFWGAWCTPCVNEMSYLDQIATEYNEDVTVVAVHTNMANTVVPSYIAAHYANSNIIFATDMEGEGYYTTLGGRDVYPYTVILDENGIILHKIIGAMEYDEIKGYIEDAGAEKSSEISSVENYREYEGSNIYDCVAGYMDALYAQADMDEISKYVDDISNFNESKLATYNKYYESVDNIKCYKFETTRVEDAYVVFVVYDLKMYDIDTMIPSGEAIVVKYDKYDNYRVHNLTDAEIIDLMLANEEYVKYVSELETQVEEALNEALAADADLREIFEMLIGIANKKAS